MSTESIGGKKPLLNVADDYTRLFTTGLWQKGESGNTLIEIVEVSERRLRHRVENKN
jgi:hypothetical protein